MRIVRNPGRIAGLWYLLLIIVGPLRLIYIPNKLFVPGNAAATVDNIATHEFLFRMGIASELAGAVMSIGASGRLGIQPFVKRTCPGSIFRVCALRDGTPMP